VPSASSARTHRYRTTLQWTGNTGSGTSSYRSYERSHVLLAEGKAPIAASSDPAFRGDASRWNPEELLVAALSSCHQLWYLHLCADAGINVVAYEDHAEGEMVEDGMRDGAFTRVTLHPLVTLAPGADLAAALQLHDDAHAKCFLANSMAFEVAHEPVVRFSLPQPVVAE
jgi:organic hydroperoxide reductase OsmC/OhrA